MKSVAVVLTIRVRLGSNHTITQHNIHHNTLPRNVIRYLRTTPTSKNTQLSTHKYNMYAHYHHNSHAQGCVNPTDTMQLTPCITSILKHARSTSRHIYSIASSNGSSNGSKSSSWYMYAKQCDRSHVLHGSVHRTTRNHRQGRRRRRRHCGRTN